MDRLGVGVAFLQYRAILGSMGILCDLFVSTPEMALKYESIMSNEEPMDGFVRAEFKSLTQLEFETPWALIDEEEYDPKKHCLEALAGEESTWLFRFPSVYAARLASLNPDRIHAVASPWVATEELQWPAEDAEEVIKELARLARLSEGTFRGLYLWGSL